MQNGVIQPVKPGLPGSTPVGMAGSVPNMKKSPSTGGRPSGVTPPPPKPGLPPDPYDKLNVDTIKTLKRLITKGINSGKLEKNSSASDIQDYLADSAGWDSSKDEDRINELMNKFDIKDSDEFFQKVISGELENKQEESNTPNVLPGVNPTQKPILKGSSMGKKVFLKDGVLVEASADVDVTPVLDGLSLAIRKVEAGVKSVANAKLVRFAADALEGAGDDKGDLGGLGELKDLAAPKKGGDPVADAIKSLKKAVEDLEGAMEGADKFKADKGDDLGFDDSKKLDEGLDMGKGALDKADKAMGADLPMMSKGIEASVKSAGEFPFKKKDEEEKEGKEHEKSESKKEEKEEHKGDKSEKAMDVAMGKEGCKVSAAEFMAKLAEKLASITDEDGMIKEAQLYPFKDLNKTNVDDINKENAKSQSTEINSEIKGQPAKDKDNARIAPKEIADKEIKPSYESGATKKVDVKTAEKIRQHSVQNAVAKAKLAVELASQQQLKGLLDNPMHTAMVSNMVDAGITKEAAEAIAYNSFIDGFESSQKVIMKEAFDTFMNHPLDEFVKVAKYTQDYTMKEASVSEEVIAKTASVTATPALRSPATDTDKKAVYRDYWTSVAAERSRV